MARPPSDAPEPRPHAASRRPEDPSRRPEDPWWGTLPSAVKRISWGAVFAGAVVALIIQLMLNLLGLAIGFGAINLTGEGATLQGLGIGTIIWLVITALIAFFAGGWTAGRLAGLPRSIDGALHGFIAWAVSSMVMMYLVFSGFGLIIGGALGAVQQGVNVLGQGVAAVAPEAGQAIGEQVDGEGAVEQIRAEIYATLQATGREDLQPENLAQRAQDVQEGAGEAAAGALQNPQQAEEEIRSAFDRLITHGEEVASAADRDAAVNVLVERTDMTEAEARETVGEYESVAQDVSTQISQTAEQAGETAVSTADDVIAGVGQAALWAFVSMVLGALAALGGGFTGTPHDMPASPAVRRE